MTDIHAPDDGLERVRAFLNTLDAEAGTDALATPASARAWLAENGLPTPARITERDRVRAVELRAALRRVAEGHHDGHADAEAVGALSRLAADIPLVVHAGPGENFALSPAGGGIRGALGVLLAAVYAAAADGTFRRLKVCPADDCAWAFYDRSRNRSRTWCAMEVCGNRAKARAYRRRHGAMDS